MGQDFCQDCNNNNFPLSKYEGNLNYKYYNNEIQQTNTHNLISNRSNNNSSKNFFYGQNNNFNNNNNNDFNNNNFNNSNFNNNNNNFNNNNNNFNNNYNQNNFPQNYNNFNNQNYPNQKLYKAYGNYYDNKNQIYQFHIPPLSTLNKSNFSLNIKSKKKPKKKNFISQIIENQNESFLTENDILDTEEKEELNKIRIKYKINLIISYLRKFKLLKQAQKKKIILETCHSNIPTLSSNADYNTNTNLFPMEEYKYIGSKFNGKKEGFGMQIFRTKITNNNYLIENVDNNTIEVNKNNNNENPIFNRNYICGKFFGTFQNGQRTHIGKFINETLNTIYMGEINKNFAEGFGIFNNISASIAYEGNWAKNLRNGIGIEKYSDGSFYKGEYKNGKKNGIGTYKWNDNSFYKGEWKNNDLNGIGMYKFRDGSYYYGEWEKNQMNGFGEFTFPMVKTYIGNFSWDKKDNFGILFWYQEQKAFIGFWLDNKQHGKGKFINKGKEKFGIWNLGKKIKNFDDVDDFIENLEQNEKKYYKFFYYDYNSLEKLIKNIINSD